MVGALVVGCLFALPPRAESRTSSRPTLADLLTRYQQGDGDAINEVVTLGEAAIPRLLEHANNASDGLRAAALDALGRIDLGDDGLLNNDAVVRASFEALAEQAPNPAENRPGLQEECQRYMAVHDEAMRNFVGRGLRSGLDPRKATPEIIDALFAELEQGDWRAAFVLGRVGGSSAIPRLEPYSAAEGHVGDLARQAMAKLGHAPSLAAIVKELELEGPQRNATLGKLAYIGDRRAVRAIAAYLSHPGAPPPIVGPQDRVVYSPYRHMAAWALSYIVEHPPVKRGSTPWLSEEDLAVWVAWWDAHQHEYP
jgi:hypothetical protein